MLLSKLQCVAYVTVQSGLSLIPFYPLHFPPPPHNREHDTFSCTALSFDNCESNYDTLPHLLHHYKRLQILSISSPCIWSADLLYHLMVFSTVIPENFELWERRWGVGEIQLVQYALRVFCDWVQIVFCVQCLLNFVVNYFTMKTTCSAIDVWTRAILIN